MDQPHFVDREWNEINPSSNLTHDFSDRWSFHYVSRSAVFLLRILFLLFNCSPALLSDMEGPFKSQVEDSCIFLFLFFVFVYVMAQSPQQRLSRKRLALGTLKSAGWLPHYMASSGK